MHENHLQKYIGDVAEKFGIARPRLCGEEGNYTLLFANGSENSPAIPEGLRNQPLQFFVYLAAAIAIGEREIALIKGGAEGCELKIIGSKRFDTIYVLSFATQKLARIDEIRAAPDFPATCADLIQDYAAFQKRTISDGTTEHIPQESWPITPGRPVYQKRDPASLANGQTPTKLLLDRENR